MSYLKFKYGKKPRSFCTSISVNGQIVVEVRTFLSYDKFLQSFFMAWSTRACHPISNVCDIGIHERFSRNNQRIGYCLSLLSFCCLLGTLCVWSVLALLVSNFLCYSAFLNFPVYLERALLLIMQMLLVLCDSTWTFFMHLMLGYN